jgi:hypothetical protein
MIPSVSTAEEREGLRVDEKGGSGRGRQCGAKTGPADKGLLGVGEGFEREEGGVRRNAILGSFGRCFPDPSSPCS